MDDARHGVSARPGSVRADGSAARFLALGDSYTIGEGIPPGERWPVQLAARLRARGASIAEPAIVARTGWTTDELASAMDAAELRGPYELISLLIGVNNQYRGREAEEYRGEFRALLGRAIALAGREAGRVLVLSIPDWGVTPYAAGRDRRRIGEEIDRYNAINREAAAEAGARYVEVTEGSRRAAEAPRLLTDDGLHPSGEMYAEWAEAALPQALEALGTPPERDSQRVAG